MSLTRSRYFEKPKGKSDEVFEFAGHKYVHIKDFNLKREYTTMWCSSCKCGTTFYTNQKCVYYILCWFIDHYCGELERRRIE